MNVIARLEYKLVYYNSAVHRFNYYTLRTSPTCFHACLRDRKYPLVSRIPLSNLADCSSAVVWMISILPLITISFKPFWTVPSIPTIISTIVTVWFHNFFNSSKIYVFVVSFLFFSFYSMVFKIQVLFLLIISRSSLLTGIGWYICISKFKWHLWVSFSWIDSGLCHLPFEIMVKF